MQGQFETNDMIFEAINALRTTEERKTYCFNLLMNGNVYDLASYINYYGYKDFETLNDDNFNYGDPYKNDYRFALIRYIFSDYLFRNINNLLEFEEDSDDNLRALNGFCENICELLGCMEEESFSIKCITNNLPDDINNNYSMKFTRELLEKMLLGISDCDDFYNSAKSIITNLRKFGLRDEEQQEKIKFIFDKFIEYGIGDEIYDKYFVVDDLIDQSNSNLRGSNSVLNNYLLCAIDYSQKLNMPADNQRRFVVEILKRTADQRVANYIKNTVLDNDTVKIINSNNNEYERQQMAIDRMDRAINKQYNNKQSDNEQFNSEQLKHIIKLTGALNERVKYKMCRMIENEQNLGNYRQ